MRQGPVTAPVTRKEARERRKAAEASMTKEERKAARASERAAREERRQLMMEGDDRYVLSRDRGDVRRFVRDYIDTHRRIINWFMPLALFVIIFQLIPGDFFKEARKYLPTNAANAMMEAGSSNPLNTAYLEPWQGTLVLAAYVVVLLGAAFTTLKQRDV